MFCQLMFSLSDLSLHAPLRSRSNEFRLTPLRFALRSLAVRFTQKPTNKNTAEVIFVSADFSNQ